MLNNIAFDFSLFQLIEFVTFIASITKLYWMMDKRLSALELMQRYDEKLEQKVERLNEIVIKLLDRLGIK
jgi:hypothetical protein